MGWKVHDYPAPMDEMEVICPVCGFEAQMLYRNSNGEVIGCDNCVEEIDAASYQEELIESAQEGRYEE